MSRSGNFSGKDSHHGGTESTEEYTEKGSCRSKCAVRRTTAVYARLVVALGTRNDRLYSRSSVYSSVSSVPPW
jgi:hypothetical protein